eukprot:CAMPEP_0119329526 /NCGR_PEP_ID=MMETSP1333-20130426/76096_1 /TAXON_ID=418940 /ORGANISM="Scyphosphaera apsteinii, Strain RCC1455" /LENGTH=108 /DNA_ID=CAMNT_0007338671 /DNA_START=15 /DNA_END=341 /DNA_ORIENTATION=+
MVLKLRLQRGGHLHQAFYRIVAADSKAPRDGKFVEKLGTYNPLPDRDGIKHVTLNVKRIKYWIMQGAQPTETVAQLLARAQVLPPSPRRGMGPDMHQIQPPKDRTTQA